MPTIQKSGYYTTNRIARTLLDALEGVMGKNGLNAMFNVAGIPEWIDNYPPDNLNREFDFADFSAINQALEDIYGVRGGRGLAIRAGRAAFAGALRNYGPLGGVVDQAFQSLPPQKKLKIGLAAISRVFNQTSDQRTSVQDSGDVFSFSIQRCPSCWGRSGSDRPVCNLTTGFLLEGVKWVSGGSEYNITEVRCVAMGYETCDFSIPKEPAG